jgi:Ca2+-binding RTX toxin-like protein
MAKSEILYGTGANDTIAGGNGDDMIFGRGGNDTLTGNRGRDTFVFDADKMFGDDVIVDFATDQSPDRIAFHTDSSFDDFDDLLAHTTQVGDDAVIALPNGTITLEDVQVTDLRASQFEFYV